jgi:REP-associated tyrosine transposase
VQVACRSHVDVSRIVQWLTGLSSRIPLRELAHLRRTFWGRYLWARGYLPVSTRKLTDEMAPDYIGKQEGEPVHDDNRSVIGDSTDISPSRR